MNGQTDRKTAIVTGVGADWAGHCQGTGKNGYYIVANYKSNAATRQESLALSAMRADGSAVDVADTNQTLNELEEIILRLRQY
ncbi:MAG: hypothetical protein R2941_16315 [Desulfobacterales bacterium]